MSLSKRGFIRKNLYELLFTVPMLTRQADESELRVMIYGDYFVDEAIKAVFWCGQFADRSLSIHVVTDNADAVKDSLCVLPGMRSCLEQGSSEYAKICFLRDLDTIHRMEEIHYTLLMYGDPERNEVAQQTICQIRESPVLGLSSGGYEIYQGEKGPFDAADLMRMAGNIQFSYDMQQDQRCSRTLSFEQFDRNYKKEFEDSENDNDTVFTPESSFYGSRYDADSSLAAAVHIPYKLAACGGSVLDFVSEIQKKDMIYNKMLALEHRRWNAYMITRGYRAYTWEEMEGVYENGASHKDNKRLLHACIGSCSDSGLIQKPLSFWKSPDSLKDDTLSDLDRASIFCYQKACRKADAIRQDSKAAFRQLEDPQYLGASILLRDAIDRLFRKEDEASNRQYEAARKEAEKILPHDLLEQINDELDIVKKRNQKIDFFANDAQLVEMLSFAIWYGKDYQNVITISDGNAAEDVIIPTLLVAKTAVFLVDLNAHPGYKEVIEKYFAERGGNTSPKVIQIQENLNLDRYSAESGSVLNYVDQSDPEHILLLGASKLPIVHYSKGVVGLRRQTPLCTGVNNKSFSIEEFIGLMGGHAAESKRGITDYRIYSSLRDVYIRYNAQWNKLVGLFEEYAKDDKRPLKASLETPAVFTGAFLPKTAGRSRIREFIAALDQAGMVWDVKWEDRQDLSNLSFRYRQTAITDWLRPFLYENGGPVDFRADEMRLEYLPDTGHVKIQKLQISGCRLKERDKDGTLAEVLRTLKENGVLRDLSFDDQGCVSLTIRDYETRDIIKTKGKMLELLVYYGFKNQGFFDEIYSSVDIEWDRDASVKNEFDVIGIRGMTPYFISCKDKNEPSKECIYEIAALARQFHGRAILALAHVPPVFRERAEKMGVYLVGLDRLADEEKLGEFVNGMK